VLLDKLLEFLANFVFLGVGMLSMLASGLISAHFRVLLFWMAVLGLIISWPIIHILLLRKRIYPLRWCLNRLSRVRRKSKIVRFIYAAEWLAGRFCQQRTRDLFFSLAVSLLLGCGMVFDYGLMIAFLGIHLQFWQIIAGWTSAWLSFLAPLPGGLGALEASQVAALGVFGVSAAAAISVTLLMRTRDLLFGGLGLIFAGRIFK
ncbi:MAG: lysylphosphatidylglycerol synthase domain-containing protein, partial [Chloroflexota bacterium]